MSDADDQMGGSNQRPSEKEDREKKAPPDPDEDSEQSFPASDPPGNY
jgi:hypothetical protein